MSSIPVPFLLPLYFYFFCHVGEFTADFFPISFVLNYLNSLRLEGKSYGGGERRWYEVVLANAAVAVL